MKKLRNIMILIFILIVIVLLILIIITKKNELSLTDKIIEQINNNEDILIYVIDKKEECYLCEDANNFVEFYKDIYNLDIIYYDKSKNGLNDYNKLINKLTKKTNLENIIVTTPPAMIFVNNGKVRAVSNEMFYEVELRYFLTEYGFIKDINNNDLPIEKDKFMELYSSNKNSLITIYPYDNNSYLIRKKIFDLSKKYKINYNVLYIGIGDTIDIQNMLENELGSKYQLPLIIVVNNNKIIDTYIYENESGLNKFLKKNNFIK